MSLTPLSRLRLAGILCSIGAWFLLILGCGVAICLFVAIYGPESSDPAPGQLLTSLALPGICVLFAGFFFLLLFALGWELYLDI